MINWISCAVVARASEVKLSREHRNYMVDRNMLGDRGEWMFLIAVSRFHGECPLFRPVLLGEKWPTADVLVELENDPGMFFLVQVKTTDRGYTRNGTRLRISAERDKLQKLANAPIPTYLVGVDHLGEQVFISAICGTVSGRSSISIKNSVNDPDVRLRLYDEVKEFWSAVREKRPWMTSAFTEASEEEDPDGDS